MKDYDVITSEKGFFIGDIGYVLSDEIYREYFWNAENQWTIHEVKENGMKFSAGQTAEGDGIYYDQHGNMYCVDYCNIGVVPLELAQISPKDCLGYVCKVPGSCLFSWGNGLFDIVLPDGMQLHIDTRREL